VLTINFAPFDGDVDDMQSVKAYLDKVEFMIRVIKRYYGL
jgi:hypothetical protein